MFYVRKLIVPRVLYTIVGVCVRIVLIPSLGVILVRVVGTYILAHPRRTWGGIPRGKYRGEYFVCRNKGLRFMCIAGV